MTRVKRQKKTGPGAGARKSRRNSRARGAVGGEVQFTNREIGWLHFNRRVLHEAEDPRTPLLEKVRFLGIVDSNLDEFFMKRVGKLKRQVASAEIALSIDGKTPEEQLKLVRETVNAHVADQARIYRDVVVPGLKKEGILLLRWAELNEPDRQWAIEYFKKNVYPILTPLSVDPGHPFPFISNLSTSLGVTLRHPERDENLFARVKVPQVLPQWIKIDRPGVNDLRFFSLTELIYSQLASLFPAMEVLSVMPFRLTRNADVGSEEEDAEDLIEHIEEELRMRRFAEVVRVEHGPQPDPWMLQFLCDELQISAADLYEIPEVMDYTGLSTITDLSLPTLKNPPYVPVVPTAFADEDPHALFALLRQSDQLVHHPFENFSATTERFVSQAAEDPKVVGIKMTLYRTGDQSPFVKALIRAAERGKQVVCLVELKARFDEERNLYWAQELENAGVHVVYGIVGLKTHAKTALVLRQDPDGLRAYAHFGTGNYNAQTSKLYTDFGFFTARPSLTAELVEFFNYLTGWSLKSDYNELLIAPLNMFQTFVNLIQREAQHAKEGRPAHVFAKMNNMEEADIGRALYEASQAGVTVDLLVRGFCTLRPGLAGVSERLRIFSAIGRFLEHSRIFYFRNGKEDPLDGDFFIGSADWMYRNLHSRVECVVPIQEKPLKQKLWQLIQLHLNDERQTWDMKTDGTYVQRSQSPVGVHQRLMDLAMASVAPTGKEGV